MTATREPWPLLDALDELLAREGWQDDKAACRSMEVAIRMATNVPAFRQIGERVAINELISISDAVADLWLIGVCAPCHDAPPFLRSRDAAALLEEAIMPLLAEHDFEWRVLYLWNDRNSHMVVIDGRLAGQPNTFDGYYSIKSISEPAARTRAALEAGHKLGLWPVKGITPAP